MKSARAKAIDRDRVFTVGLLAHSLGSRAFTVLHSECKGTCGKQT
jgi:hypothetical protein